MNIINTADYKAMSYAAGDFIAEQITSKPTSVLGLATGGTPIGTYERLIELHRLGQIDFTSISTVNLDEYIGLNGSHKQSYRYFMNKNLFTRINIKLENTHIPNGLSSNITDECARYEDIIDSLGGIDLQLLGIGHNGHIGFNEPTDHFVVNTHKVNLDVDTINMNSRFFDKSDSIPQQAITMGIGTIMKAKKLLLIANGENKAKIISKALFGEVKPSVPASILQLHPNVTIIADKSALALCP